MWKGLIISHSGPEVALHRVLIYRGIAMSPPLPTLSTITHVFRAGQDEVTPQYDQEQDDQDTDPNQHHSPPHVNDPLNGILEEGRVEDGLSYPPQGSITVDDTTVVEEVTVAGEIVTREPDTNDLATSVW